MKPKTKKSQNKKSHSEIREKIIEIIEYAIMFAVIGFMEYYRMKNW